MGNLAKIAINNNYPSEPAWYKEDVWKFDDLGVNGNSADWHRTFSFKSIKQPWLKEIVKKYIFNYSRNKSCFHIRGILASLRLFSSYISSINKKAAITSLDQINRNLIIGFCQFIYKQRITNTTIKLRIIALSNFFDACYDRKWMIFNGKLIYQEDIPKKNKCIPRVIPDIIINKFNSVIHKLDPNVKRLVLLLEETGRRISEVLKLPFDCLHQDNDGDYYLQYYQTKMKKEHTIPISPELSQNIKEQKESVKQEFGVNELLFPMPKYVKSAIDDSSNKTLRPGIQWRRRALSVYLNKFIQHNNIVDDNGKLWRLKFHEFRHTIATKMINNDVPQHIIQRFLGHESSTMTTVYAHILDQTLKEAFVKFSGKYVTITGNVVQSKEVAMKLAEGTDPNSIDAQWLKKNIMAQALPNGTSALPVISKSCPHANACLTCANFRTDHRFLKTHKQQLNKTEEIIKIAKDNG